MSFQFNFTLEGAEAEESNELFARSGIHSIN